MLPTFIGIGSQRSGTTWIYEILKYHPEVCMSPEKEVNFFSHEYEKGLDWYTGFFYNCGNTKVIGEFSPSYLANELVPQRIKKAIPTVKLIASLRNPVDQIFSRYRYMVTRQLYNKSFEEALKEKPWIVNGAYYYEHIRRYLRYFDRSQILILFYEDLQTDPHSFLRKICLFLNINSSYTPHNIDERIHFTRLPRSRRLELSMVIIRILLRKMRLFLLVGQLKKSGLVSKFKAFNTREDETFDKMNIKMRNQLNNMFEKDKKRLSELLGRDLSSWN